MWTSQFVLLVVLALAQVDCTVPEKHNFSVDAGSGERKQWALLVAGSKGYENYRHQADICHAYQVLHNHGIPDERIVVMMYDDIAYNSNNPTPGQILNHPEGPDVYQGVPKDYTGDYVTAENFLSILQGEDVGGGSGKVIESGPDDHIFVNFAGHGGVGLLWFPNDRLSVHAFISVLDDMHAAGKFAKMVIYLESSHSGSMFEGLLPDSVNIFATTAAMSNESSYACYPDNYRKTYLGDVYSVNWMEDSDRRDLQRETLIEQYRLVRELTPRSHVMLYGDQSMGNLALSEFQGDKMAQPISLPPVPYYAVPSRDVPIKILRMERSKASDPVVQRSLRLKLHRLLRNRSFMENKVAEIAQVLTQRNGGSASALLQSERRLVNYDCYEHATNHFDDQCFKLSENTYALEYLQVLVNMCEYKYHTSDIATAMDEACTHPTIIGIV